VFETYVEPLLVPSLKLRQVKVMDSLSSHKVFRLELAEETNRQLHLLSPYSRALNPTVESFAGF
jgi:hypothetical protein